MSTSLLLAFSYLNKKTEFHILQVAGNKNEFEHYLKIHMHNFKELFKVEIEKISKYTLYIPSNAKSFGATNTTVFQTIIDLSKKNGMITDPIYSAKLFYEGKKIIEKNNLTGNILFVHSGGGLSLFGFQNELKKNMAKMNETKFI